MHGLEDGIALAAASSCVRIGLGGYMSSQSTPSPPFTAISTRRFVSADSATFPMLSGQRLRHGSRHELTTHRGGGGDKCQFGNPASLIVRGHIAGTSGSPPYFGR